MILVSDELMVKIIFALRLNPHSYSGCNAEYSHCEACALEKRFVEPVLDEIQKLTKDKIKLSIPCEQETICNMEYGHYGQHMIVAG